MSLFLIFLYSLLIATYLSLSLFLSLPWFVTETPPTPRTPRQQVPGRPSGFFSGAEPAPEALALLSFCFRSGVVAACFCGGRGAEEDQAWSCQVP